MNPYQFEHRVSATVWVGVVAAIVIGLLYFGKVVLCVELNDLLSVVLQWF